MKKGPHLVLYDSSNSKRLMSLDFGTIRPGTSSWETVVWLWNKKEFSDAPVATDVRVCAMSGNSWAEEIISEVNDGLYVNIGGISVQPASGDISTSVDFGYKIEKGRLAYPVANAMIAGHIFELLKSIDAVSSDYRAEPGTVMPTIRIAALDVAGQ